MRRFLPAGIILALAAGGAWADTEVQFAATCVSSCGDGDCITTWSNPSNAEADDASYTQSQSKFKNDAGNPMDRIKCDDFGFSAVSGTVDGIEVELQGNDVKDGGCNDFDARLLDETGTEVGTDKSRGTGVHWVTSLGTWTYGGAADTWSWAGVDPTEITDVDFGFYIDVEADANTFCQPRLDYVKITVTYTAGGGPSRSRIVMVD